MQEPRQLPAAAADPGTKVTRELTHDELEAQLRSKKEAIKARVDALQDEVMTSGQALKEAVMKSPFVSVGGAVAAGLVVGLLFGGRKKDRFGTGAAHRALVENYLQTLLHEVKYAVARGRQVEDAVEDALRDRVPLVIYAPQGEATRPGLIREFFDLTLKTALGFAVKAAVDYLTSQIDLVQIQEQFTVEETPGPHGERTTRSTVTQTVSESREP